MRTNRILARLAVALAGSFALVALPASGALMLQMDDLNGNVVNLTDTQGLIAYDTSVGANWHTNIGLAQGSGATGGSKLDLTSLHISSIPENGSGTLRLLLTETDLTRNGGSELIDFLASISGDTQGNVAYSMYVDEGNSAYGMGTLIGMGDSPQGGGSFSNKFGGAAGFQAGDTYSMTLAIDVTHGDGDRTTSFNFAGMTAAMVPEPGTLLLLGIGLVAVSLGRRRFH